MLAGAGLLAVGLAVGLLAVQGRLAAGPFDPGAVVRYGLPAARAVHDLAAAVTVGLLVLAAWFVAPEPGATRAAGGARQHAAGRRDRGARVARLGRRGAHPHRRRRVGLPPARPGPPACCSPSSPRSTSAAPSVSALLVVVVVNLTPAGHPGHALAWASVLSLLALLPLALAGHAAGTADHMNSVDSLALHLLGVCLWVGGLAAWC